MKPKALYFAFLFVTSLSVAQGDDPFIEDPFISEFQGNNGDWTEMGPNGWDTIGSWSPGVGRVNCLAVDPNDEDIILAGTRSGVWKTTDGGTTWIPLNESKLYKNIQTIAIDPTNSNTYYIGTYNGFKSGISRSIDAGQTWTWLGDIDGLPNPDGLVHYISYILLHPTDSNIIYAAKDGSEYYDPKPGVYRSQDGGLTWSLILESKDIYDMEFKPGDPNVLYVGGLNLYRSPDGGDSWAVIPGFSSDDNDVKMIGVSPDDPEKVYVLESDSWNFGGLYVSDNSGLSFTKLDHGNLNFFGTSTSGTGTSGTNNYDDMSIAVNDLDAEEVHIGGNITWRSTDGGQTFTATSNINYFDAISENLGYCHQSISDLSFKDGLLYASTSGGIFKVENTSLIDENYYTDLSADMGIRYVSGIDVSNSVDPVIVTGNLYTGSSIRRNNVWKEWLGGRVTAGVLIDKSDDNLIFATEYFVNGNSGDKRIYRTNDGGYTQLELPKPFSGYFYDTVFQLDHLEENTLYLAKNKVFKSSNNGESWTAISPDIIASPLRHLKVAASNNQIMYASGFTQLYKSLDGGSTWNSISMPQGLLGTIVFAIHPTNPNIISLASVYYDSELRLFVSYNGGSSWLNYRKNLPELRAYSMAWDDNGNNGLYLGLENGVYYIDDTRSDWVLYSNNLPTILVTSLKVNPADGRIYAGTAGRGVWSSLKCDGCVLGAGDNPAQTGLVVYPNPANDRLNIALNNPTNAWIYITDMSGKELYSSGEVFIDSEYTVPINYLSPGVYIVKLVSGDLVVTRKVIVK